jgi:2-phospho-L-lactate/phosphoenolpyruvate guanylyltransferase
VGGPAAALRGGAERIDAVTAGCVALVPVKPPDRGKSRLVGVPGEARGRLAAAFALDTVRACLAVDALARVLVVTDDADFATEVARLGAETCPDGENAGLNAALRHAAATAAGRWPRLRPVALCADLPAVRPDEIGTVLGRLPAGAAYVADAEGTGTTLYSAAYDVFDPRYGIDSAAAHAAAGALALEGDVPGLRRDVDDLADLREAASLGVGPATSAVLPELLAVREADA